MIASIQWNPQFLGWCVALSAVVIAALVLIEYSRSQRPLATTLMLAALRGAALIAIGVAALRPSFVSERPSTGLRRVVVMIDDSRSMETVDSGRSVSELVQFAELTGQIGGNVRRRPAGILLAKLQTLDAALARVSAAEADVARSKNAGVVSDPLARELSARAASAKAVLDDIRDLALEDTSTTFAEDRLREVERSLADPVNSAKARKAVSSLASDLRDDEADNDAALERTNEEVGDAVESLRHSTRFDFAIAAAGTMIQDLQAYATVSLQRMQLPIPTETLRSLSPKSQETPLLQSLRQTIERSTAREIDAIIVLTDGRSTESRSSISPVVSAAGVPIYPVMVAAADRMPDVRVMSVDVPSVALHGQKVPVIVRLRSRNAEGKPARITVSDGVTRLSTTQTLRSNDDAAVFAFPIGERQRVELRGSVDPIADEELTDNNVGFASIAVEDRRAIVAAWLPEGDPGIEVLRNALQNAPWVDFKLQPTETAAIESADVIVLAGEQVARLNNAQCEAIRRAVTSGKSVFFVAGSPEALRGYVSQPALAPLLPVVADSVPSWSAASSVGQGVQASPTPFSGGLSMVALDDLPEAASRRWLMRPRLTRLLVPGPLRRDAVPLVVDRATQTPILTEAAAGLGRSLLLSTDESWLWRQEMGVETYERFWLNSISHLIEPKPDVADAGLELSVEPKVVTVGRPIDVRCRVPVSAGSRVQLLLRDERGLTPQAVYERLPDSGRWLARFVPNRPGPAELVLRAGGREVVVAIRVLPPVDPELADVSPDPALLKRIAGATGGEVLSIDQIGQIAQLLRDRVGSRVEVSEFDAWSSPYLFGAVLGCLGLEWVLRKQKGLV